MSNDLGSVPMQTGIILLLIAIHGLFVLINTALGAAGRNKEKLASANKLIILLCAVFGGLLAFTEIWKLVVYLVLLVSLGQYFPRKIALQHAEAIAEKTLAFDDAAATILRPVTWTLMLIADILLRIFRQNTKVDDGEFSEEEVMSMLEVGQETGVIKEEGKKMINSIFAFDDKLAYEVMTPRTDVFLIDIEDQPDEYLDDLMTLRHSRIPVCEGETDNIIGILNIKDYLIKAREDGFDAVDIKSILRKAYFVPETKNIDSLFFELQKTKQQIAILIDEYGGFSGIVTMEDIIEEIVGDIQDEFDNEREDITSLGNNTYLCDARVNLRDLNDTIDASFPADDFDSLGGFVFDLFGKVPVKFEKASWNDFDFIVQDIEGHRINSVKVIKKSNDDGSSNDKKE